MSSLLLTMLDKAGVPNVTKLGDSTGKLELVASAPRSADVTPAQRETSPQSKFFVPAIESAASSLGVQALAVPARATGDIEPALESFARQPNGGLILHPSAGKAHRRFGASPSPADDQHG